MKMQTQEFEKKKKAGVQVSLYSCLSNPFHY